MITFGIRESKDAISKTVVTVECDVKDLGKYWTAEEVNDWTAYGFRVAMQAIGRGDVPALEAHLKRHVGDAYTIDADVKVEKKDTLEAMFEKALKKFGPEKIAEMVAKASAQ